jgi:uncharacterized membrane protein YhfC
MLLGAISIGIIAESLTIISFILGGYVWVKKEFQKEHDKLKLILEKIVSKDKKKDELLENVVKKIHTQNDKLTEIIKHLNRIDIYLAKHNTDYGTTKLNQPIFRTQNKQQDQEDTVNDIY